MKTKKKKKKRKENYINNLIIIFPYIDNYKNITPFIY